MVTVDAGDIFTTFEVTYKIIIYYFFFKILKTRGICCSLIGLSAEVHVYKKLCSTTTGNLLITFCFLKKNYFFYLKFFYLCIDSKKK